MLIPDDDWFEISDDMWLDPRFNRKKLKLFADAQIPQTVIAEIAKKIPIDSFSSAKRRTSDPSVLTHAHGKGFVLLTLDQDFWNDRKYPLHSLNGGIIYIAEPPDRPDQIIRAFSLVYVCFARSYPLDWWKRVKVKATVAEFEIKMRSWQGKVARYRIKVRGDRVVARELEC